MDPSASFSERASASQRVDGQLLMYAYVLAKQKPKDASAAAKLAAHDYYAVCGG